MSEMKCATCKKYIKPDPSSFNLGDKVCFMQVNQTARGTNLKAVDGKIINLVGSDHVLVQHGRQKLTQVKLTGLTHQGQPGPITYQMFGVCSCGNNHG